MKDMKTNMNNKLYDGYTILVIGAKSLITKEKIFEFNRKKQQHRRSLVQSQK